MKIPEGIITKPIHALFTLLLGNISPERKKEYGEKLESLLVAAIAAGAEGAARGAAESLKDKK